MATIVTGEMYQKVDGQLFELKRQIRQPNGYPFDPQLLSAGLQELIEGCFGSRQQQQVTTHPSFKVSETNLSEAIKQAEKFAKKILGVAGGLDLKKKFGFPEDLPWQNVMVIYDPGTLNNRDAVQKAIKDQGIDEWEETDVMNYSGSEATGQPTLHIIENSLRPSLDTMNKSPDMLMETGRIWLTLRRYALAFGLRYLVLKDYLDPETWTWCPNNRLPSGDVARGGWRPYSSQVKFFRSSSSFRCSGVGARSAIPVPLAP
ncbi:MAG: hypothetical protein PHF79_00015 [Candidatus Pacebacteria bacterium]|nr:hypothetical protein [Candidatus Paceibacterota bacterium]